MTMSSAVSKVTLNGDGVQTSWPFAFKVWKAADLEVSITNAAGVTTVVSNWSVVLAGVGGTVTYPTSGSPLPGGSKITIARSMDFLQDVDLVSGTRWDPEVVETALDQATAERQQLKERLDRSLVVDIAASMTPEALLDSIYEARDTTVDNAASALDSAERAEIAATTVAYYNHEGTLEADDDTITLPWAYDTTVGVEVFLSGVKQTESSLSFTDAYTVTLDAPVSADTGFEVVASAGARGDLANTLAHPGGSSLIGFLQAGTGAVSRTVQAKLRDVVSVFDFMTQAQIADVRAGTVSIDCTASIQAAIDSVRKTRRSTDPAVISGGVYIPAGKYLVSSTIYIDFDGFTLFGDGPNVSVLYRTTDYGNTIDVKWARGQFPSGHFIYFVHLRDFAIESSIIPTTDSSHILFQAVQIGSIRNVTFVNGAYRCFDIVGCANFEITSCYFYSTNGFYNSHTPAAQSAFIRTRNNNSGATLYSSGSCSGFIKNCRTRQGFGAESVFANCYAIMAADGVWIDTCYARQGASADFRLEPFDAYTRVTGVRIVNCWSDNAKNTGILIRDVSGGGLPMGDHIITGTRIWGYNSAVYGMVINCPNLKNLTIDACIFSDFKLEGIDIRAFTRDVKINNTTIYDCNGNNTANTPCIMFDANLSDFSVIGCLLGYKLDGTTALSQYGIIIASGCDNYVIANNNVLGNATKGIQNNATAATNGRISNNVGYLTEARGSSSIAVGTNTKTVTHGLGSVPQVGDIVINKTGNWNGVSNLRATNYTATTFDVISDTNATSESFFGWQARMLR